MKKEDFDTLKKILEEVARTGNAASLAQTPVARLVVGLLAHHEDVVRAEGFWGDRAPTMNEELLALRPLEKFARLALVDEPLPRSGLHELADALAHLDEVRGDGPRRSSLETQVITTADVGNVAGVLAPGKKTKTRKGDKEKS